MCGIVGAIAERNIEKILIEGLRRLEYRGYDSAGLAVINSHQAIHRLRAEGKVRELENALKKSDLKGNLGIAHTRWATHGIPSERNAHPLISQDELALVHNGIIENHEHLRKKLLALGYHFTSETDTETIVHLLHHHLQNTNDFLKATCQTVAELEGAYALGIISTKNPERVIAVRHGSPLVLGKGIGENFFASDTLALMHVTQDFMFLEDGDIADLYRDQIKIYNTAGKIVERPTHAIEASNDVIDKGEHRHYMMKEILEQSRAINLCLEGRIEKNKISDVVFGLKSKEIFPLVENVQLVACGTSYHAAMVAKYWLESIANVSCSVEIASEFRYRKMVVNKNTLFVSLSQSGETADTLAAFRLAKKMKYLSTLAICNVPESSLVRESDLQLMTRAGIEIGVASTKAFTTQLTALLLLTLSLGKYRGLNKTQEDHIVHQLQSLPDLINKTLAINEAIKGIAQRFSDKEHALFLGRGPLFPIALEGALKLKEISYIHAEGYPAGELKHGPLALVDKNMPVIAIAPNDELLEKIKSNLQEVKARGGELFIFSDQLTGLGETTQGTYIIPMPTVDPIIAPIVYTIPLQLLSYHVAVLKGTDVDQPRNLAKSVTVE